MTTDMFSPEQAAKALDLTSTAELDHFRARNMLHPIERPTGVLWYHADEIRTILARKHQLMDPADRPRVTGQTWDDWTLQGEI